MKKHHIKEKTTFCISLKRIKQKLWISFFFSILLNGTLGLESALALTDYSKIPDHTWVLVGEGTYAGRDAGMEPPVGILAFSGMAVDTIHQKLLVFGGGHTDYWGNEVWTWDINTQKWQKMYEPDPIANIDVTTCKTNVDNTNFPGMWLPSKKPISRHTYGSVQFITHKGVMLAAGGSLYSGPNEELWNMGAYVGCYNVSTYDVWTYDPVANSWSYKGFSTPASPKSSLGVSAYDSNTGLIIGYSPPDYSNPAGNFSDTTTWTYNIDTDTWTNKHPSNPPPASSGSDQSATYDSKRSIVYMYGSDYPSTNALWTYSVSNNTWALITPQGTSFPPAGGGYGTAYDSVNDLLIIFGRNGLWVYDPTLNHWTQNPGNPSLSPSNPWNVFGDLKYDSVHNVTFFLESTSDYRVNVWAYRYSNNPRPAPPTGLTVK